MKAKLLTFALLSSLFLSAHAQNEVYSNVVGMVKLNVPAASFVFVGTPLNAQSPISLNDFIGDQLTGGSSLNRGSDQILAWDSLTQSYQTFWKDQNTNEWKDSNGNIASLEVYAGFGFWVRSKQNVAQELIISGGVPDTEVVLETKSGFNQFGFPYPVEMDINDANFALAAAATGGRSMNRGSDQIMFWDSNTGQYQIFWKADGLADETKNGKWLDESSEIAVFIVKPGQGFWFRNKALDSTWEPIIPYNL
ncbi:MAG: hypothetical protein WD708_06325 [Kiritimatiellia bacterium]